MKQFTLAVMFLAAACGGSNNSTQDDVGDDDDPGDTDPHIVAGGGTTGAPINGRLHVYAIDAATGAPIEGATVRIETPSPSTIATDTDGLASFIDPALTGPQTVTVTASGHAAVTWVGVPTLNVTLPVPSSAPPATAHVKGSISGLSRPSSTTKYVLALALYSFLDDPSAPENSIVQPTNSDGTPKNACVLTILSSNNNCNWELTTRTGMQIHTAVIVQGDTHGTNDDTSDDTYTLIGYAAGSPTTLTAGQQVNNESLAMISATSSLNISLPSPPAGLTHVTAIPELALGAAGRIVLPLPPQTSSGSHTVIAPTGSFAGHYEVVAVAAPNVTAKAPFSTSFGHGTADAATVPAFLPAPGAPSGSAGAYTFTGAAGASFHTAQFTRGTTVLWNVTLLDGSTSIHLPAVSPNPLGAGSVQLAVSAADAPGWTASHFNLPDTTAGLDGASGSTASVSP